MSFGELAAIDLRLFEVLSVDLFDTVLLREADYGVRWSRRNLRRLIG